MAIFIAIAPFVTMSQQYLIFSYCGVGRRSSDQYPQ
ncbi:hypothetical protein SKA53_11168 [Yoonia vestfoldensis SKA53]|uniref:Uncharacterized protein n=1 Tax=Yoonia vestfoldensis SKA53 TaxID=314232 RepID=A3V208_9RHOB|nr:hypothetical protein SKA53_11168 [Yoonia vestfoldensis SKA53]